MERLVDSELWRLTYLPEASVSNLQPDGRNRARTMVTASVCICGEATGETVRVWLTGRMVREHFRVEQLKMSNSEAERLRNMAARARLTSWIHELTLLEDGAAELNLVAQFREVSTTCLIIADGEFAEPSGSRLFDEATVRSAVRGVTVLLRLPVESTIGPHFEPRQLTMPESIYEHFAGIAQSNGWAKWRIRLTWKNHEQSVFDVVEVTDAET